MQKKKDLNSYDASFKNVINNKSLLAYILKTYIDEYKELEENEIKKLLNVNFLEELNTNKVMSLQQEFTNEHGKVELDKLIGVKLPDGSAHIGLFINFEMQRSVKKKESILPRAIYYVSKVIEMQKDVVFEHMDYHKLLKVYGVWICLVKEQEENTLNHYRTSEYNKVGKYHEEEKDYDKSEIVVLRLGIEEDEKFNVLNTLFVKNKDAEEKIAYLKEKYGIDLEENREELEAMCTPEEFFEARYKYMYRREGRLEGLAEGKVEGMELTLIENIKTLMKNLNQSYEEVTTLLDLDKEKKERCHALIFE